jgi:alpha-beta hydrolase superfamily lysophospholipase
MAGRRQRGVLVLLTSVVASSVGCSVGGTSDRPSLTAQPSVTTSPSAMPVPSTASRRGNRPGPPFAVGFRRVSIVDRAAGTPARGDHGPRGDRPLVTSVWYPRVGTRSAGGVGRFPLVVFAHGFNVTPQTYARLLDEIAAQGYVVAAPLFPISGAGLSGPPREDDLPNQALDLRAVISAMTTGRAGAPQVTSMIDPGRVAVVGHSDGGETVAALLLVPRDRDPRVSAAVILAGQVPTWAAIAPTPTPVLVEQATADTINAPRGSRALYARLDPPKAYLNVIGANHLDVLIGTGRQSAAVRATIIAFLAAELTRSASARARLRALGNQRGCCMLMENF